MHIQARRGPSIVSSPRRPTKHSVELTKPFSGSAQSARNPPLILEAGGAEARVVGSDTCSTVRQWPSTAGRGTQWSAQDNSDAALVEAIAAGDKHALQVLYGRHHVKVYRFALRFLRDEASAEDMVSEVFIDVWRQAERFERRCQVSTWLLAIARNKALSSLRRRSNEQLDDEVAEFIEDPADNPEVAMQKQERGEILRVVPVGAVAGAPRDHRPRLLSRAVDRGGLRDHRRAGQHREDPHVLCPQADRRDDGGPRHRALRDLSALIDSSLHTAQESGEVPP